MCNQNAVFYIVFLCISELPTPSGVEKGGGPRTTPLPTPHQHKNKLRAIQSQNFGKLRTANLNLKLACSYKRMEYNFSGGKFGIFWGGGVQNPHENLGVYHC